MTHLAEVAGIIANTLAVDPIAVHGHVEGLRAAGHLSPGPIDEVDCADLLCCVLSTDQNNATGPFGLPFAGGLILSPDMTIVGTIDINHPAFNALNFSFGQELDRLIRNTKDGLISAEGIKQIYVQGHGESLMAQMIWDGYPFAGAPNGGHPVGSRTWVFYGYRPASELIAEMGQPRASLTYRTAISGQVLFDLATALKGEYVAPFVRDPVVSQNTQRMH